jgi:hypothetical protein
MRANERIRVEHYPTDLVLRRLSADNCPSAAASERSQGRFYRRDQRTDERTLDGVDT